MTGAQVYMMRVDGQDILVVGTSLMEAINTDYQRWLAECQASDDDIDASREAYDFMIDQIVHVGEIELVTGSAIAELVKWTTRPDPLGQALNEGDGSYRP